MYDKAHRAMSCLNFFTTHEWRFIAENSIHLLDKVGRTFSSHVSLSLSLSLRVLSESSARTRLDESIDSADVGPGTEQTRQEIVRNEKREIERETVTKAKLSNKRNETKRLADVGRGPPRLLLRRAHHRLGLVPGDVRARHPTLHPQGRPQHLAGRQKTPPKVTTRLFFVRPFLFLLSHPYSRCADQSMKRDKTSKENVFFRILNQFTMNTTRNMIECGLQ